MIKPSILVVFKSPEETMNFLVEHSEAVAWQIGIERFRESLMYDGITFNLSMTDYIIDNKEFATKANWAKDSVSGILKNYPTHKKFNIILGGSHIIDVVAHKENELALKYEIEINYINRN